MKHLTEQIVTRITRREFNGLALSSAVAVALGIEASPSSALETADITWTSDDPHLSGNYAPMGPEIDVGNLPVVAGAISPDLRGAYMRNGPNPLFKPLWYAYPMDGDGMIHAVYFENGRARYRNRFVQTGGLVTGKPMLQWQPSLGTRIGLIALDGSSVVWLDADPFFVFHFGNGFERAGHIFIDYVRHDSLNLGYAVANQKVPTLHRMIIDVASRKVTDTETANMVVEFPRFNDAYNALPTRFVYVPTLTDTLRLANPPSATFNTMMKVNTETGDITRHDFGNRVAGEPTFIPRKPDSAEDDGYLAIFAFDPVNRTSDLVLLDAAHLDAAPVAVIRLPQRVPQGLHGSWVSKA
jgi:carotenoid cleavage dioxygenase-like enzyme